MSLTSDDLKSLRNIILPLEDRIIDLQDRMTRVEEKMDERFNTMDQYFDALFKRDEAREQEYLILTEQVAQLEQRVSIVEKRLG